MNVAFARIPFDTVLTSNVDFVLEDAWRMIRWPFEPVVGELGRCEPAPCLVQHRVVAGQRVQVDEDEPLGPGLDRHARGVAA